MHKVTCLFSHIHVDCTFFLAWFHMKTRFTWTQSSFLTILPPTHLLSSSAELQLQQRTGNLKIPSTVKIFNRPERRNSFSNLNTGRARKAVLNVPAHLKPVRKKEGTAAHTSTARAFLIPQLPTLGEAWNGENWGHLGKEDPAESSRYCRYEGKETRRMWKPPMWNRLDSETAVENHVGQWKKQRLLMWRRSDFQRKKLKWKNI